MPPDCRANGRTAFTHEDRFVLFSEMPAKVATNRMEKCGGIVDLGIVLVFLQSFFSESQAYATYALDVNS